jgi:hypothetical protein
MLAASRPSKQLSLGQIWQYGLPRLLSTSGSNPRFAAATAGNAMSRALLDHPLTKGTASLLVAIGFVFFPVVADAIRARKSAAPIRITAPPGTSVDALECQSADSASRSPRCR